jgi:hypothetical protein
MKILAASIARAADSFLHAGYISAYPRPLNEYSYPDSLPVEQLDVAESLRLQGETLASGATADPVSPIFAWHNLTTVALVAAAFGLLALLYLHRRRFAGLLQPAGAWAAATMMMGLVLLARCGGEELEPLPTEAPWKGVVIQKYQDPEAATKVLLHGIIAEALASMDREITTLPNIQNEVSLPAAQLTRGQQYALKTYGIDGWGRELRLDPTDEGYTVTSAGADGQFGTSDDRHVNVRKSDNQSWDSRRRSFFLREDSAGSVVVLFHRWTGSHFEYNHLAEAQQMTGGEVFDLFQAGDLQPEKSTLAKQAYMQVASAKPYAPMVLQVFGE